jgi:hypothetical protein
MPGRYRLINPILAIFAAVSRHQAPVVPVGTAADRDGKTFTGDSLTEVLEALDGHTV